MLRDETMRPIQAALRKLPRFPTENDTRTVHTLAVDWANQKRRAGWKPAQVIVEMKACAAEVGLECPVRLWLPQVRDPRTELIVDLVLWCIQGYFRDPDQERMAEQMSA
jgi:hypothetical protein